MNLEADTKQSIIKKYKRGKTDTGSAEVQVALLSEKISQLTEHLKKHKKDHATRRGLRIMVGRRSRLLRYLRDTSQDRYTTLIQSLGLRK